MNSLVKSKSSEIFSNVVEKLLLTLGAMLLASLFLMVSGYDFSSIFVGVWNGITKDFSGTIRWMTPLLFTSLAVVLSQKANLFNLGVDGQLNIGACASAYVALNFKGYSIGLTIALVFLAGIIAGALYASIPALLKIRLGAYEVVTTLLMNFIAVQFLEWLVLGPLKPDTVTGTVSTENFRKELWLPRILEPSQANVGVFIAIVLALIIAFIMYRTVFGHEIKMVGSNENFAKYSGINTVRVTLSTMLIGGAIAGLAGTVEIMGSLRRLPVGFNQDWGFDGIVVALLASNNPIACIFTAFFIAALRNGAANMERFSKVPSAASEIVQALVLLIVTAHIIWPRLKNRSKQKSKSKDLGIED